jgi:hypothetical protein
MTADPLLRDLHPARRTLTSRARVLYHALNRMGPEEGCALLAEALELAERYGHRDPDLDGFAVQRQALCDCTWELGLGRGSLLDRVKAALKICHTAVARVDDEEVGDWEFCFRLPEEVAR